MTKFITIVEEYDEEDDTQLTHKEVSATVASDNWFEIARQFPTLLKGLGYNVGPKTLADFYNDAPNRKTVESFNHK